MKKLLTLIILTLCVIFAFSACGGNDTPVDTSTDTGPQACSHSATTTIEGYAPTCTKTGLTDGKKCVSCGAIIVKQETISKVSHTFSSVIKIESSCGSSESYSAKICKDCGYFESNLQETVLHPHSFEYYTREATCTLEGIKAGFKCKNCNYIATEIRTEALGHSYDDNYTPNGSNHYAVCQRCGDKKESSHVCKSFTTVKEPNCFEKGRKVGVCTLCDGVVEEDIPIKHSWNNGAVTTEATCISKGDRLYTCTICGETKTEVIYEKPHPYDDGITTKEPTCTEAGSKLYTCTYCTGTKTETISALGHNWDNGTTTVEANCYQTGNIHYLCQRCDAEKDKIVPKLHSFDKGTTLQEASCTQEGKVRYTCTICSAKYDVTLGIKHNTTHTQRVENTCTKDGNIEYWQCNDCKKYFSYVKSDYASFEYDGREYYNTSTYSYTYTETKSIVLKAKGHKYPSSWSYDSTQHYYLCKNDCGTKNNVNNHTMESGYRLQTGNGYYSFIHYSACQTCSYLDIIDSKSFSHKHTNVELLESIEATCTQNGLTYGLACGICDEIYIEQETIPALGHNYVNAICTRCGLNSKLGTTGLTYELNSDGTAYICTGIGTATTPFIVIGSEYNGLPVTEIKANAFMGNYNIVSVVIPTTIKAIGDSAFYNCQKLVEVYNLSNSITVSNDTTNGYVGNYALDIYTDLSTPSKLVTINKGYIFYLGQTNYLMGYVGNETKLVFPNMFMGKEYSIYKYAFYDNDKITSITIGLKTKVLGGYAFYDCSYLTEINFNAIAMDDLSSKNYVFYSAGKDRNGIKVTIGKNVTKIPAYLFCPYDYSFLTKITSVVFEKNSVCESIGNYAFYNCTSLTSVTIPNSVTSIGEYAFYSTLLTSIIIPNSVTSIGSSAFEDCTSLTSITIPDSVTSIGDRAFYDCESLKEVHISDIASWCNISFTDRGSNPLCYGANLYINGECVIELVIPNTVTYIKEYAFYGSSLKSVTIPSSVTTIGSGVFNNCKLLVNINVNKDNLGFKTIDGNLYSKDGKILIQYAIGKTATSFNMLESVVRVADYAFEGCSSLKEIHISNIEDWCNIRFGYVSNPLSNGANLYINGKLIKELTIPNTVTEIKDFAFYGASFTSITIPDSVTSIAGHAFGNCTSLTSITIPDSVTSIGEYAFSYCSALTSIKIPEGVTLIRRDTFSSCTSLTSITIPNSVTLIGDYAFFYCTSLTSVTIGNSVTSIGSVAFSGCTKLYEIYNLSSLDIKAGDYNNGNVGYYAKVIHTSLEEESILETVNDYIFMTWEDKYYLIGYVGSETEITLPESYKGNNYEIYQYAFYKNNKITKVTIPNSVTSIGDEAFYNCTSLTSVTIGNSVTSIGSHAFSWCGSLTSVTFKNTSGWYVTTTKDATSGTNVDVTNATTNATNLKSTYNYYHWYRTVTE